MPKAITHAQMVAASAAGEPRPEWCFRADPAAWPPYQIEWLATWRPDAEPLPPVHDVVRRNRAWQNHRDAHKRALAASARVVDLRPPPLPPGPGSEGPPPPSEADDPEFYLVSRHLLVAEDSWRLQCQEISEIFAEEPVLTPSGKHARRALRARRAGGGNDGGSEEEEDFVVYSLEPGGRASDRKRRRKKGLRRERLCLQRLDFALNPTRPEAEAAEEGEEEGGEVPAAPLAELELTAARPPASAAYGGGDCVGGSNLGFLGVGAYSTGY